MECHTDCTLFAPNKIKMYQISKRNMTKKLETLSRGFLNMCSSKLSDCYHPSNNYNYFLCAEVYMALQ